MKHHIAIAFLLVLAACSAPAAVDNTTQSPQQTFACPDGTVVTNISECPQTPDEQPAANTSDEDEQEQAGLLDAKFDEDAFSQVFTTDDQPTPPVGSSLRDIQARALQKTLDGYSYTYFEINEDQTQNPQYQTARVYVRSDELAIHYPEPVSMASSNYDRIVNGVASCEDCRPNTPEPAEVQMPPITQPLDVLLQLQGASDAQSAQSISDRRTLKLTATLNGEDVTVFVDQFSGLPLEIRYPGRIEQFKEISLSASDDAFTTIQP